MLHRDALKIADRVFQELFFHCERIEIAGDIRRKLSDIRIIDIVCTPKMGNRPSSKTGKYAPVMRYIEVINKWRRIKGEPWDRTTSRFVPIDETNPDSDTIQVNIHQADENNWGYMLALKTGSGDYFHRVLAAGWVRNRYNGKDGYLYRKEPNQEPVLVPVPEERDLFRFARVKYIEPESRN